MALKSADMRLSDNVTGITDVNRLLRELKVLNSSLEQQSIRHAGSAELPKISKLLDELSDYNKVDLTNNSDRSELASFLEGAKAHAPTIHISVAQEPHDEELTPVVAWIRKELNRLALIQIGVQPGIIGGCTVRTPNHFYDFSLKQQFEPARDMLLTKVRAL